ncbi:GNAT family N-acetyltransferase [Arthrobacter sp. UM1]|uniref:GNAT family N-acetyltransferase n=1 Tax=Arthrobacter sp. UM1 TaxID=2766776 RepID=UPI001CF6B4A6|nr:GNAT family N-acetyltransferase [Arthrobacter sp. UM1]MCB4208843.1 GNAT family N-acetyltransferase [Arthrobacter sp. UM1]
MSSVLSASPETPASAAAVPSAPDFAFRRVDPDADAPLLHAWFTEPRGRFWGMGSASVEDVRAEHRKIDDAEAHDALLGLEDGEPAFLLEVYDPAHSPLAGLPELRRGDLGMHLFVGPARGEARSGYSTAVMCAAVRHILAEYGAERILVEPDVRNTAVHALNERVGFRPIREVLLDEEGQPEQKRALLSVLERTRFFTPDSALTPGNWDAAERWLSAKLLAEFAHERLIAPVSGSGFRWSLELDDGRAVSYTATRHALDHWTVDPASVVVHRAGSDAGAGEAPRTADLVLGLRSRLPLTDELLPVYLEEIQATLAAMAGKTDRQGASARRLARGEDGFGRRLPAAEAFQAVESAMTEGHPCFIANSGRHGMGAADLAEFAPESGRDVRLVWLAVSRQNAHFSALPGLTWEALAEEVWDREERASFEAVLRARGLDPEQYAVMPAHPWQVEHKVRQSFAGEVARGEIVILGESRDLYRAQQSLRTFFNVSRPERPYAKTALSVVNMGFMRGLSAAYMKDTPAINAWLAELFASDAELRRTRVGLIRETAAVGYRSPLYEAATEKGSAYRKMLAGLWRESPVAQLAEGEQLATMASLLHVDADGASFAGELVRASGLSGRAWVRRYLEAYLVPVVHFLSVHRLAFMPHGENVILVLRDGAVDRVVMKDIGEEIAVLVPGGLEAVRQGTTPDRGPAAPSMPEGVDRICADVPSGDAALSVFTDVFDCFLRFLAPILAGECLLSEDEFWAEAKAVLQEYARRHPDSEWLGLFEPEFELSCLNRLQLRNSRNMLDLEDQNGGLQKAGTLVNPVG